MQITEFEPLSHHRKLPNLGLHRMRDTKRLFGGPVLESKRGYAARESHQSRVRVATREVRRAVSLNCSLSIGPELLGRPAHL